MKEIEGASNFTPKWKKLVDIFDFNFFQHVGPASEIFSIELPSEGKIFNILL